VTRPPETRTISIGKHAAHGAACLAESDRLKQLSVSGRERIDEKASAAQRIFTPFPAIAINFAG
jgi:hypothetical protein